MLPAGTFSWTQVVRIRKGITVQGQSMTYQTGYVWFNSAYADDQTIILDDSTDGRLISMSLLPTQSGRITGITFRPGTTRNTVPNHAPVGLSGSQGQNKNIRLDHCHFDHLISHNVFAYNVLGLADHNLHEAGAHAFSYYFENGNWGGESRGNGSWADYPYYGSDLFFFVEDCTIRGLPGPAVGGGCDAHNGARYVFRWNHWENAHHANHGTEANPIRGTRNRMLYHNRFNLDIGSLGALIGGQRSGGAIIHDNETTGAPPGTYPSLGNPAVYRESNRATAWGFAQGSNPWDVNVNGGQLFESGTATIGSVIGVVKDTTKHWMPGRWVGYSITDLDAPHPFNGSVITANTSTTITYKRNDEPDVRPSQWHNIRPGHRYEIHKIDIALDQGGVGKGDLIRDVNINGVLVPKNTTCNCKQWPHQQSEPLFEWNNTNYDGSPSVWSAAIPGNPSEHQGRDYFDLGINIPAGTIPAQVTSAYPASVNGGSAYTQDFIYPHPLQAAGNPTPTPTPIPTATPTATPTPTDTPTPTPTATP